MTKTEKLILFLCQECIGDNGFDFTIYENGNICVYQFLKHSIVKTWNCNGIEKTFEQELIATIKEIRAIKRGKK